MQRSKRFERRDIEQHEMELAVANRRLSQANTKLALDLIVRLPIFGVSRTHWRIELRLNEQEGAGTLNA